VKSPRETCDFKSICGETGHYFDLSSNTFVRCACMLKEIHQKQLGVFFTATVKDKTVLSEYVDKDLMIEGALSKVREHVARALLELRESKKSCQAFDSYRLMDIFLEKDGEYTNYAVIEDVDLFVLLLGYGEIANRRLPDCCMQVITRRELRNLPTWVVLGIPREMVPIKFNVELADKIGTFKRVEIR